jgi:DtxR family Mn-dependent transcriptional regulator
MADSESREMYLKTIYELEDGGEPVAVSQIAARLGVSAVSANEMVKRLADDDLVVHTPYKGVELTGQGRLRALSVVRRQRLWGRFLADQLGIRWEDIYDFACRLEHATDDAVTEALATFLDYPATCPHGNPIPGPDGSISEAAALSLNEMGIRQGGVIARIDRPETTLCLYLAEHGVLPGVAVSVEDEAPYNGPLTVRIDGKEIAIGREIAARIFVTPASASHERGE